MDTIKNILSKIGIGKYVNKSHKEEINKLCEQLTEARYKLLKDYLLQIINTNKMTKTTNIAIEKLLNELQKDDGEQLSETIKLIEDTIKMIEDDDELENKLDEKCKKYNKFTKNNPAEYITYNIFHNNFALSFPNKKNKSNKNLSLLITELQKYYQEKNTYNIIDVKIKKKYDNKIILYEYKEKEMFDVNHILHILQYKDTNDKYTEIKKYITHHSIKKNKFGGFYIKEYILKEQFTMIFSKTRKHKLNELIKLANIDTICLIPIETQILNPLINIYETQKPISNYKVDIYFIDLYFEKSKIAIECDEHGHNHISPETEKTREKYIKKKLNCKFIRFNPNNKNFNIFNLIKQINQEIYKINKE
jgi:very-short-patch-repair endonuclease